MQWRYEGHYKCKAITATLDMYTYVILSGMPLKCLNVYMYIYNEHVNQRGEIQDYNTV